MILKDKKILITGILTDKSIAYASAQVALENGAQVVATGFGKGLSITERAVKRLSRGHSGLRNGYSKSEDRVD